MGLNLNNAAAFSGFLKGWDQETDMQRKQAEEDRTRANNQRMVDSQLGYYGANTDLLNQRVNQARRQGNIEDTLFPMTQQQAKEQADQFAANAPVRQGTAELTNQFNNAALTAKKSLYTPEVMSTEAAANAEAQLRNAQAVRNTGMNDQQLKLWNSVANSMNVTNVGASLKTLGLDNVYEVVNDANGIPGIIPVGGDRDNVMPVSTFSQVMIRNPEAVRQLQSSAAATNKSNAAIDLQESKNAGAKERVDARNFSKEFSNHTTGLSKSILELTKLAAKHPEMTDLKKKIADLEGMLSAATTSHVTGFSKIVPGVEQ